MSAVAYVIQDVVSNISGANATAYMGLVSTLKSQLALQGKTCSHRRVPAGRHKYPPDQEKARKINMKATLRSRLPPLHPFLPPQKSTTL